MKRFLIIFFLLFSFSPIEAQTFKILPLKYDAPCTMQGDFFKYDKLDHFAGTALLTMCIPYKKYRFWLPVVLGLTYEIYDGFDWKRSGGFSVVDMIANIAGTIFGIWLQDLFHQINFRILR